MDDVKANHAMVVFQFTKLCDAWKIKHKIFSNLYGRVGVGIVADSAQGIRRGTVK